MEIYNYADEIVKDNNRIKLKRNDVQDILENILAHEVTNKSANDAANNKVKGFMEGLKNDNDIR